MALIESVMTSLESAGSGYVQTAYQALAAPVLVSAKILFGISVAWYGIRGMLGMANFSFAAMFQQLFYIVLIVAVLTSWPIFQTFFYDIVLKFPEQVGTILFSGFDAALGGAGGTPSAGLQRAWDTGWEAVRTIWAKGGVFSVAPAVIATFVAVGTMAFVIAAFFIVAMSKIFAYILLAIAPVFIFAAIFDWTRGYFKSYVNALFYVSIALIMSYAVVGFFLGLSAAAVESLRVTAGDATLGLSEIAPFLFFMFLGCLVFVQIPTLASMVAGGIGVSVGERFAYDKASKLGLVAKGKLSDRQNRRASLAESQNKEARTLRQEQQMSSAAASIVHAVQSNRTS